MKTLLNGKRKLMAGLLLLAGLVGCSVVPEPTADLTRFYVLNTQQDHTQEISAGTGPLQLGLERVEIAPYLDKGSLVVRRGNNELVYNDYARWAEPIGEGVSRIVRSRLLDDARVGRVFVNAFPFDQARDYDISIYVVRCEGAINDREARFTAVVEVTTTGDDARVVSRQEFVAPTQTWDGRDYSALVAALSTAVDALSDQIVTSLP